MKKITIVWIIIIIILLGILTIIGINRNEITKDYRALENDLVEGAKVYYGQDTNLKKLPNENQIVKISISELKEFGININNNINNDECEGYVKVTGKSISHDYKSYVKCKNYITQNYGK